MSTPFEAEADTARAMASKYMDEYRIEQWELAQAEAGREKSSLKPVREDVDVSWYYNERSSFSSALYQMWIACLEHCAVITTNRFTRTINGEHYVPAYGLASDIAFAQMLFTDLYIQMSGKIKPEFDPTKPLGENVYRAKEAGMKYKDIAKWIGEPELVKRDPYTGKVKSISKKLITAYRNYARENEMDTHQEIGLDGYVEDFCSSYSWAVVQKFRTMRGETVEGDSMSLAIIDITDLSREAMWEDFPELRPHPADCDCDRCHRCSDPDCQRPRCKAARTPVKTRGMGSYRLRNTSYVAQARGAKAGSEASIMGRGPTVGQKSARQLKP
jgi:hypothetical protein